MTNSNSSFRHPSWSLVIGARSFAKYLRPIFFVLLAVAVGCDDEHIEVVPVAGRVTVDGQALRGMVICFVSASGYAASCPLADDGTFRLTSQYGDGMPAGEYRVTLAPDISRHEVSMEPSAKRLPLPVAERYQFVESSGLVCQVQAGDAPLQFHLQK